MTGPAGSAARNLSKQYADCRDAKLAEQALIAALPLLA